MEYFVRISSPPTPPSLGVILVNIASGTCTCGRLVGPPDADDDERNDDGDGDDGSNDDDDNGDEDNSDNHDGGDDDDDIDGDTRVTRQRA